MGPVLRPIQHIDRKSLYTNLDARIQYLHSFLDFSTQDINALVTGAKYIKALIPAIVNIVYRKLLQYDITARAFETRSTSFEGPMDEVPDENSPQLLHRKAFLRAYLNKICSDPTQMEFWEYLDKVGMMHVGLGRAHPLHVEYIHIGACLSLIQDILTEAILSHPRLPLQRKMALIKALSKVIWIQNDLFAKWYVKDGAEFKEEDEDEEIVIEKEGYLHGKKILAYDEDSEGGESSSDSVQADMINNLEGKNAPSSSSVPLGGGCPFSGMTTGMGKLSMSDEKMVSTDATV
ncbi:Protoglobin-domain-containing protein [Xylogone sp. PMI_703]|nr:Protoglobin-domain-containing protein [Xylogone sp. PMI_703]